MNQKNQLILIYFSLAIVLMMFYFFDPATTQNIYPPSLSREWGGFYCPGCGTLRAIHQLLHGNWRNALRLNPLIVIFIPYFFYWMIPYFCQYFYRLELYQIKHQKQQLILFSIAVLVYGLLRNTSHPTLSWLVPPS